MTIELVQKKKKIKTPTLDKMLEIKDKSRLIGEFIEWLGCRDPRLHLCELDEDAEEFFAAHIRTEKLLAEFFGIDLDKAEKERCQILDAIRAQNDKQKSSKTG